VAERDEERPGSHGTELPQDLCPLSYKRERVRSLHLDTNLHPVAERSHDQNRIARAASPRIKLQPTETEMTMTQVHKAVEHRTNPKTKDPDPLARVRVAAQELHGALSDAAAKRGEAMKSDLQAIPAKAKAVAASLKESLGVQGEATKKHLEEAAKYLETTEKHVAHSLKATGHAFDTSVRQAVADARAAAQKISEAVAAKRTVESTKTHA